MTSSPKHPDAAELYLSAQVDGARRSAIATVLNRIAGHRALYEEAALRTSVPWWLIACLHHKESGLRFDRHLHNGDPLEARTVNVPRGRLPDSEPPYTWVQSCTDALRMKQNSMPEVWDVAGSLNFAERYNGLGYRSKGVYSPYLWCATNHYTRGHYVADHRFDPDAVAKNPGAAALLLMMEERGMCDLDMSAISGEGRPALATDDAFEHEAPWMTIARSELELDVRERSGADANPRILGYLSFTQARTSMDETPWCAAFVAYCLEKSGMASTRSAAARSYEGYGLEGTGEPGDIAVFWREQPDSHKGHVAFVDHVDEAHIYCLGGNQYNAVSVRTYPRRRLLGYRRPVSRAIG
jgi:uncharacterized protein (TIGR02594 family)